MRKALLIVFLHFLLFSFALKESTEEELDFSFVQILLEENPNLQFCSLTVLSKKQHFCYNS